MATFNNRADIGNTTATINTNFSRGSTLASWLVQPSVGGSTMLVSWRCAMRRTR